MTRNLKILGLAVLALLAVGAATASSASAVKYLTGFETEQGGNRYVHTILEGNQEKELELKTSTTVKCQNALFAGTLDSGKAAESFTLTPTYSGCYENGLHEAPINLNGCDYQFGITEKVKIDEFSSHFNIVCPAGKSIEIKVYNTLKTEITCEMKIPAQTSRTTVTLTNKTAEMPPNVTMDLAIKKIEYTITSVSGPGCEEKDGTYNNGEYLGSITLAGYDTASKGIDLEVCLG